MMLVFLMILTIYTSSCGIQRGVVQLDIPSPPVLPTPHFEQCGIKYCTNKEGLRNVLDRDMIRDAYEQKLISMIKGCNTLLK